MNALPRCTRLVILSACLAAGAAAAEVTVAIDAPMVAPAWARLQRELLAEQAPACREFYERYFDARLRDFKLALHRKDLAIAIATARAADLELPVSTQVAALEDALIARGHGGEDVSALARWFT